jgi:hypothetical protein
LRCFKHFNLSQEHVFQLFEIGAHYAPYAAVFWLKSTQFSREQNIKIIEIATYRTPTPDIEKYLRLENRHYRDPNDITYKREFRDFDNKVK